MVTRHDSKRTLVAALLALGILGFALPALAEDLVGQRVVLEKDLDRGTLTLDGPLVLQVTADTRITDAEGRALTLADVPSAVRTEIGYEVRGDESVEYEAVRSRGRNLARSIVVRGGTVE